MLIASHRLIEETLKFKTNGATATINLQSLLKDVV